MAIEKSALVAIRDYLPEDKNFIFSTFLRGLYYGDSWFKEIPKRIFMENYHKVVEHLIHSNKVQIKVACLKDEPSVILGYSVLSADHLTLHWVFCKSAWRKIGIAKSLVPAEIKTVTHLTQLGLVLVKKTPEIIFNPFAIE